MERARGRTNFVCIWEYFGERKRDVVIFSRLFSVMYGNNIFHSRKLRRNVRKVIPFLIGMPTETRVNRCDLGNACNVASHFSSLFLALLVILLRYFFSYLTGLFVFCCFRFCCRLSCKEEEQVGRLRLHNRRQ